MQFFVPALVILFGVAIGNLFTLPAAATITALLFIAGVGLLIASRGTGIEGLFHIIVGIPLLLAAVSAGITTVVVNNVVGGLDLSWLLRV